MKEILIIVPKDDLAKKIGRDFITEELFNTFIKYLCESNLNDELKKLFVAQWKGFEEWIENRLNEKKTEANKSTQGKFEEMDYMLTNNITKLGKNIWSFNLPRSSCKHKTELCQKYCYGKRGRWLFHNEIQEFNLKQTKDSRFVDTMSMEIDRIRALKDAEFVRIHSLGDFYSQQYFDKWAEIARNHRKFGFLAYTRNYDIDCSKRPKNMRLYYSIDHSTKHLNKTIELKAFAVSKEVKSLSDNLLAVPFAPQVCRRKCSSCHYCYEKGKDVIFYIH